MKSTENNALFYKVEKAGDDKILVVNEAGRVIMTCHDLNSASHYVTLLNEAFKVGYKLGYHDANIEQR
jgi:hypothetical protein